MTASRQPRRSRCLDRALALAAAVSAAVALWPGLANSAVAALEAQSVDGALDGARAATPLDDPAREAELDALTAEIGAKLRCPVCRQQSVTESSSRIAREMQALIRTMLIEGRTPEEIEAYFVDAYGPWILLQPPAEGVNVLVYALPAAAFLLGGLWIFGRMRAGRAAGTGGPALQGVVEPGAGEDSSARGREPAPVATPEGDELDQDDRAWLESAIRGG